MDERAVNPGDMWVVGQGAWAEPGFSIGTQVRGACLNINSAGVVSAPYYITTPEVVAAEIRASTADQVTVNDSVIITGNLTVEGTFYAENSNPFWAAGRFNGTSLFKKDSAGRSDFNVERVSGFAAGVYRISFNSHPKGGDYITNATASAVQCGVMNDPGYTPNATEVIVYSRANTGALVDSEMNFMILV
jgi:hypothetical protein